MLAKKVYEIILNYRLPLDRKSQSSEEFFKDYSGLFISDLASIIDEKLDNGEIFFSNKDFENIISFQNQLISILKYQSQSNTFEVVNEFEDFMKKIEPYLLSGPLMNSNGYQFEFYKIRTEEFPLKKRSDLFVVPENKRPSMQSQRFSIPGSPCLYLATDLVLAWYECDTPMLFSTCQYAYKDNFDYTNIQFLDFRITPIDLKHNYNFSKNPTIYKKYLFTFLLRAVCSIKFKTPNAIFKEEYIIPQLLMGWIRRNQNIVGIQYQSCSKYDQTNSRIAYNIAIPSMSNKDGCKDELWRSFNLSEPEFYSINELIIENLDQLNIKDFEDLLSDIEIEIQNSKKPLIEKWMKTASILLNIGKYYKIIYESIYDKTFKLDRSNYYALQNTNDIVHSNNLDFCNDQLLLDFFLHLETISDALSNNSITTKIKKPSNAIFLDPFDPNEEDINLKQVLCSHKTC